MILNPGSSWDATKRSPNAEDLEIGGRKSEMMLKRALLRTSDSGGREIERATGQLSNIIYSFFLPVIEEL
jgi:hypothetical protein